MSYDRATITDAGPPGTQCWNGRVNARQPTLSLCTYSCLRIVFLKDGVTGVQMQQLPARATYGIFLCFSMEKGKD